jgi:hypothetical protein
MKDEQERKFADRVFGLILRNRGIVPMNLTYSGEIRCLTIQIENKAGDLAYVVSFCGNAIVENGEREDLDGDAKAAVLILRGYHEQYKNEE